MPRFFFHIRNGRDLPDPQGTELMDRQQARSEAIRTAGEMLRDMAGELSAETTWEMKVTDEAGRPVLNFRFVEIRPVPSDDPAEADPASQ